MTQCASVFFIVGGSGTGKTTHCLKLIKSFKHQGLKVTGLVSPAVFENEKKIQINACNILTGQTKVLATVNNTKNTEGLNTPRWQISSDTIKWGNEILESATPTDALIVDELGPLEFDKKIGWTEALKTISEQNYKQAYVCIRPECLKSAFALWPYAIVTFESK